MLLDIPAKVVTIKLELAATVADAPVESPNPIMTSHSGHSKGICAGSSFIVSSCNKGSPVSGSRKNRSSSNLI
jgi:hypothetical protein